LGILQKAGPAIGKLLDMGAEVFKSVSVCFSLFSSALLIFVDETVLHYFRLCPG
jgi:hypothetical protein